MGVYVDDNKFVIIIKPKIIRFNLTRKIVSNLKHKIKSVIKHNEFFATRKLENKIS